MIIPVSVGILTNIYWMLVAEVIRGYICYYLNAYYTKYVIDYSIWEQVNDILPSIRIALTIALPMYALSFIPLNSFILLSIQIAFGIILFFYICERTKKMEYVELREIVLKITKKVNR